MSWLLVFVPIARLRDPAAITGQVAGDGRSDGLKGVRLLAVYVIPGLAHFVLAGRG